MAQSTKKRYNNNTSAVYITIGIALILIMSIIGTSAFMRANEIKVEGFSAYSIDDIVEASGISLGDNLLFINVQTVSHNIRRELPFINSASVTRVLPDKILISITESEAIAKISFAGETLVSDSTGRILARSSEDSFLQIYGDPNKISTLIDIRGLEIESVVTGTVFRPVFGSEMKLQYMQDVLNAVEREGLEKDIQYLDVSNIVNVHLGYLNKFKVNFGGAANLRQSNLRHNLGRLSETAAWIDTRFPNTSGTIDMTDANADPKFVPD